MCVCAHVRAYFGVALGCVRDACARVSCLGVHAHACMCVSFKSSRWCPCSCDCVHRSLMPTHPPSPSWPSTSLGHYHHYLQNAEAILKDVQSAPPPVHMHTHTRKHKHTHTHAHAHTHAHTHANAHKHTHTLSSACPPACPSPLAGSALHGSPV